MHDYFLATFLRHAKISQATTTIIVINVIVVLARDILACFRNVQESNRTFYGFMDKLGLGLDDLDQQQGQDGEKERPQLSAQEERRLKIQRCIQSLVHATHCREINCQHLSCAKMKRVVEHTKTCKRKTGGGCRICQEFIDLCCYHAKQCQERECVVPFCRHIKTKLRQQQTQQRFTSGLKTVGRCLEYSRGLK